MSSDAKCQANRENARRSTGPRSPEGKERAAQNARRHGVMSQPALEARRKEILATGLLSEVSRRKCFSPSDADVIRFVDAVARLQLIRDAEVELDAAFVAQFEHERAVWSDQSAWSDPLDALCKEARLLARYRSEAASRRRRALRGLLEKHQIDEQGQA